MEEQITVNEKNTTKCEHHRIYLGSLEYCFKQDIACLCEKYGFENISEYTVKGPYSNDVIYFCDGNKLEKNKNGRTRKTV